MKLILHIGTEKTGTTTAQVWAANNREALARQGVLYSRVLGATCHVKLHLWCLTPGRHDESFQRIKILSEADRLAFQAQLSNEFATEVADAKKSGCHTFVISNELCHSRLVMREEVQRAREFLEPHFDEIELLCGLRPQIDLAVSHASNLTRAALRVGKDFFDGVAPDSTYYNYKTLLDLWTTVFGVEAKLVPIRRTPDIIAVLAAHARIDTTSLEPPVRVNESIDVRVMAMMNAIKDRPVSGSRWIEPFANIPRDVLKQMPCEERLQPGLEVARSVQARFEGSNRELTNGRTDVEFSDLEPDWSRYEGPGNLDLLEQPCAFSQELAAMVQIFNQSIALAELHNEVADTERHLDLHHPVLARRCLNTAQRLVVVLKQAGITRRRLEARIESLAQRIGDADRDIPHKERRQAENEREGSGAPRGERRRAEKERQGSGRDAVRGERRRAEKEIEDGGREALRKERRRAERQREAGGRNAARGEHRRAEQEREPSSRDAARGEDPRTEKEVEVSSRDAPRAGEGRRAQKSGREKKRPLRAQLPADAG